MNICSGTVEKTRGHEHLHQTFIGRNGRDEHAGVPRRAQHQQKLRVDRREKETLLTLTFIQLRGVFTRGWCATAPPTVGSKKPVVQERAPTRIVGGSSGTFFATHFSARTSASSSDS